MFIIAPIIRMIRRGGYSGISMLIVISFGKNPVRGGMPLIDIINRGIIRDIFLCELQDV